MATRAANPAKKVGSGPFYRHLFAVNCRLEMRLTRHIRYHVEEWVQKPEYSGQAVLSMPIYEYECRTCGHRFDALQKMSEEPLLECPECEQPQLRKLLSAPRFRLKGKGWYETDFKSDNQRNLADAKAPESKDQPAKDGKSDKFGKGGDSKTTSAGKGDSKTTGKSGDTSSA